MDPENLESVTSPDSQAGDATPAPEPRSDSPETPGSGKDENRIPYSRVKEMMAKERERAIKEFQEKEYGPLKTKYEEMNQRMVQAELARLEKMGWYKPEQPKPVTREELQKMLDERESRIRQQSMEVYHQQRINDGWAAAAAKYPGLAKRGSFQEAVLARYATNPRVSFIDHADAVAGEYDAYFKEKSAAAAAKAEEQNRPDRRVVPSGRGAGATDKNAGSKPKTVAEKIAARLRERNES